MSPADILILSNGPGEVTTWVRPVVTALRQRWGDNNAHYRISVMLSPCPHAMGKEAEVARRYPEIDRVQSSEHFFDFLLRGKTQDNWQWHCQGVVVFLGGDQFYALMIGRRLGYRTVIYAEWEARWYRWLDAFAVMNESVRQAVPIAYQNKMTVIGDLMADVGSESPISRKNNPIKIGLLPGSKASKLSQGVPLSLAIAEKVQQQRPQVEFQLFVAPTVELATLANYAHSAHNPLVKPMGGVEAHLSSESGIDYLVTTAGSKIELITQFPAHDPLSGLTCAITTVGANTAELGALAIPMLVLLPTQQLDAMKSWDGLPGLLARIPGVGRLVARLINYLILRQKRLYAWPNIWAREEIVPELVGHLSPEGVADQVIQWLDHPDELQKIGDRLREVRGKPGAAQRLAELICQQLQS